MDWQEEPATSQQLLRLQSFGFVPTCPLTVTQAARLIRQFSKHPSQPVTVAPAPARLAENRLPARQLEASPPQPAAIFARTYHQSHATRSGIPSLGARLHAHNLRLAAMAAEQAVQERPDAPGVRADLRAALIARQQFWRDTCREGKELESISEQALEFYEHFGAAFFPPTWEEVQELLEALDGAMPGWEHDHPELYYEALKLNFPSLLRQK